MTRHKWIPWKVCRQAYELSEGLGVPVATIGRECGGLDQYQVARAIADYGRAVRRRRDQLAKFRWARSWARWLP